MQPISSSFPKDAFRKRREAAQRMLKDVNISEALFFSGHEIGRTYPANVYPFRASSHFLYFVGAAFPNAILKITQDGSSLFLTPPPSDDELWHGKQPDFQELAQMLGITIEKRGAVAVARQAATISHYRVAERLEQSTLLERDVSRPTPEDKSLRSIVARMRMHHDELGQSELRKAVAITHAAHESAMQAGVPGATENEVRAAFEYEITKAGSQTAYQSIVTTKGNVLHQKTYPSTLSEGDLVLLDGGAESPLGYASDVTRTWPVSGTFSEKQKQLYEATLDAQKQSVEMIKPGIRYRDIHLRAGEIISNHLFECGILRGDRQAALQAHAFTVFFPHGVGHIIGLDVHDMEDLGDEAGYQKGFARSDEFGLRYLRLDRTLDENMAITIEPGIYFVPAILRDIATQDPYREFIDFERTREYAAEVSGIRIEDDVLVTGSGHENLSEMIPKDPKQIEEQLATRP